MTNAVTVPFTVENSGVMSAEGAYTTIAKGSSQEFTICTTTDAKYLMLYIENGSLTKTWEADKYSTVNGSVRTWKVTFKIGTAGKRVFTFKAGSTTTPTNPERTVSFEVK